MQMSIKALRVDRGMTQEMFAKAVGVSKKTVYLWESGEATPGVDKVAPICQVLKVSYDDIRWNV